MTAGDTATASTDTPNIDDRLGRIESTLERIEAFLELTRSRTPAEKKKWLNAEMEKRKCVSWELLANDLKFTALFPTPAHFHLVAKEVTLMKGWRTEKIDNNRYYFGDGFDIESLKARAKWRNYNPGDKNFHEYLTEQILAKGSMNILDFLRAEYPNRGDEWCFDVTAYLKGYVKKIGYKIDIQGDVFTKRGFRDA